MYDSDFGGFFSHDDGHTTGRNFMKLLQLLHLMEPLSTMPLLYSPIISSVLAVTQADRSGGSVLELRIIMHRDISSCTQNIELFQVNI